MKKIFAILMTAALLLSMGTVLASAELPADVSFTPGGYSADAADFTPAGDFAITWDPEASSKLDLTDGDMADWAAAGYNMVTIDASNMIYWVKDDVGVPEGWQISTYFVADSEWFYIGFFVTDPAFTYGATGNYQHGDAFQVCIDFGGRLGDMLKTDPDNLGNKKNIFYSFGCIADGAPIEIMRQESDNDAWITEANGDGVKGAARATESGWSAEFALSWQQLYDDYSWKSWEDPNIYIGGDQKLPLKIGCCLYYLDRSEANGALHWAAGSTNGIVDDEGVPQVSWTAYDNGLNLALEYVEGMTFACDKIIALPITETIPPETTAEETTEAPTEPATKAPETQAPTTDAPATTTAAGTTATTEPAKGGCGAVVGFGVVAVLTAAAAVVALKKKD